MILLPDKSVITCCTTKVLGNHNKDGPLNNQMRMKGYNIKTERGPSYPHQFSFITKERLPSHKYTRTWRRTGISSGKMNSVTMSPEKSLREFPICELVPLAVHTLGHCTVTSGSRISSPEVQHAIC